MGTTMLSWLSVMNVLNAGYPRSGGSCDDSMQTRGCRDVNNRGINLGKSLGVQPCSTVRSNNVKKNQLALLPSGRVSSAITSFTAPHYSALGAGVAVVALLAGIVI